MYMNYSVKRYLKTFFKALQKSVIMSMLVDKPVSIKRLILGTPNTFRAVSDPARAQIVELLYHRSMTAAQIADALRKGGYKKALTTVRHHIRVLKAAGLIQVTRVDEVRGTISKQYGTSIRLFNFDGSDEFETKEFETITDTTRAQIDMIILAIKSELARLNKEPEDVNNLVVEILNRAITKSLESNS